MHRLYRCQPKPRAMCKVEEGGVATTFCCRLYTLYLVQYISPCLNVPEKGVVRSLMKVKTRKGAANTIQEDR
jgi:hypothetical protein